MAKVMRFPVVAVMTGLLVLPSAGSCADTAARKTPPAIERLTLGNESPLKNPQSPNARKALMSAAACQN
ncbi:hypothetical protein VDQ90_21720, partial [Xanthomonas campestris pv. campestris]|nr:hypothetical protein [Xanthomonas campestris pv. campestris]